MGPCFRRDDDADLVFKQPGIQMSSFRDGALAPDLRCAIAHRGISRFRVWSFGPSRNDVETHLRVPATRCAQSLNVVPAKAGTHTPRPFVLNDAVRRLSHNPALCGYGSLRSQGRRMIGAFGFTKHTSAFPRRNAPELYIYFPPNQGRGECRAPNAPAAWRAEKGRGPHQQ